MARINSNGSSQSPLTRKIGPSVRICQINIEGISYAKSQYLSRLLKNDDIDLVAIQETHCKSELELQKRGRIPGYELLGATYHQTYGTATYIKNNIENASIVSISSEDDIQVITTKIGDITVSNIYKPPTRTWPTYVIKTHSHPTIYVGDFNSHHEHWKYRDNDTNGETLVRWAEDEHLHLVFDAKDKGTFRSAAWNRDYNPDLCFVSTENNGTPLATSRTILSDFPHSQHRPAIMEIGIQIPLIRSTPRPRWNFQRANWTRFSSELDKCLGWIPPHSRNYGRFIGAVISTAKKCIPRGYRKEYIPGWSQNSDTLYHNYLKTGDQDIAEQLLSSLDAARQQKWSETVENLNFQTSSRKAWSLLRKLGGANAPQKQKAPISPNLVASHIVATSRAPRDKAHTKRVKKHLKTLKSGLVETQHSRPFNVEEVVDALKEVSPGKAPGFDGIHPEFLLNCGKYARTWLAHFFTNIMQTSVLPQEFKRSKVIAILKPGKPANLPNSYRPIALLSTTYKLLERLIYNRIGPIILDDIPIEQAGFRPKRSCTDQVLSLTTLIEAGFQKKLKSSAAFIDLSAAYDTVWREGMIYKFLQKIPCKLTAKLIDNMLNDRVLQVTMGLETSSPRKLKNGLPQGSVLAPLLFSLYIADMPDTTSTKFGYADDWALITQTQSMEVAEGILNRDLEVMGNFFRLWRLQPNASKTEVACFHLNNKMAERKLNVLFDNLLLKHNKNPKYLGVILDRTLSFKDHLTKTAEKLKSRNNIIQKLCGSTWGALTSTLRSSALGLVYSAAEYCAPVWINSAHVKKVDAQLNNTMRMITGTIRSTPTQWLPVLSNIPPPHLRRTNALIREYKTILNNRALPVHSYIEDASRNRLRSRKPPIKTAEMAVADDFNITTRWVQEWSEAQPNNNMPCITESPPGTNQPRKIWCTLNRIRTQHGRCAHLMHRWGKIPSPLCDCGEVQTIRHITEECRQRRYEGHSNDFLSATPDSIDYIKNLDVCL